MELTFAVLMLALVFKSSIVTFIGKHHLLMARNAESLIKYFGASAILSATVAILPSLFMITYMRTEGFFAYEIFSGDSHAFGVLAGNIFVNFLILSFGFFGAAVLVAVRADNWSLIFISLLNGLFITYFLLVAYVTSRWVLVGGMVFITLLITVYLYFWLSSGVSGKAKFWYAPLAIAALITLLPILLPTLTAELTASALAQMKVGGMLVEVSEPTQIFSPDKDRKVVKQWLVLRTREALYLKPTQKSTGVTVLKAESFIVSPSKYDY